MECPKAIKIWFGSRLNIRFQYRSEIKFKDWNINTVNFMYIENLAYLTATTHTIWYDRNELIFENK
jgi:hypothetical protein